LVVTDVSSIKTSRFARKDDCSAQLSARSGDIRPILFGGVQCFF
jgi:hypothetical protein